MKINEIKKKAKNVLKGNVGKLLGVIIVVGLATAVLSFILETIIEAFGVELYKVTTITMFGVQIASKEATTAGNLVQIVENLISIIIGVGIANYCLKLVRGQKAEMKDVFNIIPNTWKAALVAGVIYMLNIAVGTMLFIIPGIIAALGLCMYDVIIADENGNISGIDALKKSWNMMKGYKGNLFGFYLSFILWYIACIFVFPAFYVIPYVTLAVVVYYDELKKKTEGVPTEPITQVEPVAPVETATQAEPIAPVEPIAPAEPVVPVEPAVPVEPVAENVQETSVESVVNDIFTTDSNN